MDLVHRAETRLGRRNRDATLAQLVEETAWIEGRLRTQDADLCDFAASESLQRDRGWNARHSRSS